MSYACYSANVQPIMESPYRSPQSTAKSRCVRIVDRTRLVIPHVCVACGDYDATLLEYTQDHVPLVLPGIGIVWTTDVTIPYCAIHARRFQSRFSRLRIAQLVAYILAIVAGSLIFIPGIRDLLQLPHAPTTLEFFLTGGAFLFLIVSIFLLKPFLYDVFIAVSGNRVCFKGGVAAFRENLTIANRGNVDEA